jgi:hypothetical protein
VGVKETTESVIVKFLIVIGLECNQGKLKLSTDVGVESKNAGHSFRLGTESESPNIMSEVVNKNEVVLESRKTKYRRGPNVCMNKLKGYI